jgi:hypothetical protein
MSLPDSMLLTFGTRLRDLESLTLIVGALLRDLTVFGSKFLIKSSVSLLDSMILTVVAWLRDLESFALTVGAPLRDLTVFGFKF